MTVSEKIGELHHFYFMDFPQTHDALQKSNQ